MKEENGYDEVQVDLKGGNMPRFKLECVQLYTTFWFTSIYMYATRELCNN